jgi:hypothetical protein
MHLAIVPKTYLVRPSLVSWSITTGLAQKVGTFLIFVCASKTVWYARGHGCYTVQWHVSVQ